MQLLRISLIVMAKDAGNPPMSSETTIIINIIDENDHDPLVTLTPVYPSSKNKSGRQSIASTYRTKCGSPSCVGQGK